jgi:hypothetical protein
MKAFNHLSLEQKKSRSLMVVMKIVAVKGVRQCVDRNINNRNTTVNHLDMMRNYVCAGRLCTHSKYLK